MPHRPVLGVRDLPSLPIQNLRSHLVLQEGTKDVQDANVAQINGICKTPLPVPGWGVGYSQSVYCWSWANSVGLSEIHPPSLIFGRWGPKRGGHEPPRSPCQAHCRRSPPAARSVRGTGGSRPAGTIPPSPWAPNPGASEQPLSTFLPRAGMERGEGQQCPACTGCLPFPPLGQTPAAVGVCGGYASLEMGRKGALPAGDGPSLRLWGPLLWAHGNRERSMPAAARGWPCSALPEDAAQQRQGKRRRQGKELVALFTLSTF